MSIIGRGSKSIRKQDVVEQKSVSLAFKKIVFAHQANSGEAGITVTSLVAPPDMTAKGFVNPSASVLTRANIYQNKNNLKIVSSLSGLLIPYLSYTVNSSTYIAFNGFTASQDEVFTCYLDDVPTTSLSVVDGDPIIASGTLLAGQTDFNIGTPIEINKYSSQQIGAVMVYVDRVLQYRKVGNVSGGSGDYIEVPVAGGLGSIIRFNSSGASRFVVVVSNGVVAERPSGSMTAMIENVQGQIDQIVPTVAALAGVSTTNFQISPNSVDLKQFGDTVLNNTTNISTIQSTLDKLPTIQKFTSGSGTYTCPTDVKWIRVRMVGGGGGGAGSGTASGTAAGTGGNTTFGTSLLTANGGSGAVYDQAGASGGSGSLGSITNGFIVQGGSGGASSRNLSATAPRIAGASGGNSFFGGGGSGGSPGAAGTGLSGVANAGGGGGGAEGGSTANSVSGAGGGGGGYVEAIIQNPVINYSYSVGLGGTAGGAGTSGLAGGAGGSGVIIVEEYYK